MFNFTKLPIISEIIFCYHIYTTKNFIYEKKLSYNTKIILRAGMFLEHLGEPKVSHFLSCNQPLALQLYKGTTI